MTNYQQKIFASKLETIRFRYSVMGNLVSQFLLDLENGKVSMEPGMQYMYYRTLRNKLGDITGNGLLQSDIDRILDNVLKDLKRDFPYFTRQQRLVFSLVAADIPDRVITLIAHLKSTKMVWVFKRQMADVIIISSAKRKDEYLMLLDCQQLSRTTSVGGIRS